MHGIGVQGQFNGDTIPDPVLIKNRLDTLAKANIPVWISELIIERKDENIRADLFDKILRLLYGHPAVEGIILWGFWSERNFQKDLASLVSGREFRINAAGKRVLDLLENQWMTKETHVLSETGNNFTVNGFHGDYEIRITYKGKELMENTRERFTLGKSPTTVYLAVLSPDDH